MNGNIWVKSGLGNVESPELVNDDPLLMLLIEFEIDNEYDDDPCCCWLLTE